MSQKYIEEASQNRFPIASPLDRLFCSLRRDLHNFSHFLFVFLLFSFFHSLFAPSRLLLFLVLNVRFILQHAL